MRISIHALREEGDRDRRQPLPRGRISIHALREEGDPYGAVRRDPIDDFYPRPPRGGRRGELRPVRQYTSISIHALREEGDFQRAFLFVVLGISIHALREEGDLYRRLSKSIHINFYPRPPRGGRLIIFPAFFVISQISIHALREEGDGLLPGA